MKTSDKQTWLKNHGRLYEEPIIVHDLKGTDRSIYYTRFVSFNDYQFEAQENTANKATKKLYATIKRRLMITCEEYDERTR